MKNLSQVWLVNSASPAILSICMSLWSPNNTTGNQVIHRLHDMFLICSRLDSDVIHTVKLLHAASQLIHSCIADSFLQLYATNWLCVRNPVDHFEIWKRQINPKSSLPSTVAKTIRPKNKEPSIHRAGMELYPLVK
jgi:hypothetical protein